VARPDWARRDRSGLDQTSAASGRSASASGFSQHPSYADASSAAIEAATEIGEELRPTGDVAGPEDASAELLLPDELLHGTASHSLLMGSEKA